MNVWVAFRSDEALIYIHKSAQISYGKVNCVDGIGL